MPDEQDSGVGGLVPPALLSRLEERIREALDESPPTRDSGILRREIAELLPRAGAVGLYEYLGISVGATTGEGTASFIDLGRRVHPSLAGWVDLPEGVLRLLFEHAAHAYLVLRDPVRRKDYDPEHPPMPEAERRSDEELAEVRREMARRSFRRAQSLMRAEQYHYVVELMREAVTRGARRGARRRLRGEPRPRVAGAGGGPERPEHRAGVAPGDAGYRLKLGPVL